MIIPGTRVLLRDEPKETDFENFFRWWNLEEWKYYDEPDQPFEPISREAFRQKWKARQNQPKPEIKTSHVWRVDTIQGRYIGWVNYYQHDRELRQAFVGICLPEEDTWNQGYGSQALTLLIGHLFREMGLAVVKTATWTGNVRMVMDLVVVVNSEPEHGRHIRYTIEQAGPVIYVLFFTLVGARFQLSILPTMGLLGIAYIVLRSIGKYAGSWLGSTVGGATPAVRDNLGLGLLSQAGVAIGLALASASRFSQLGEEGAALGSLIINVVTATTFVVQIIGPVFVKLAITRAGEVGMAKGEDEIWASEGTPE